MSFQNHFPRRISRTAPVAAGLAAPLALTAVLIPFRGSFSPR